MRPPLYNIIIVIVALVVSACASPFIQSEGQSLKSSAERSVIRVTVTSQGYQFHSPWQQRRPTTQTAIGAIVPGGQVLVTATLVANHRYIELESIDTKTKYRAAVAVVDYEANLALLTPLDDDFMQDRAPLEIANPISQGDSLAIWQVKQNGNIIPTTGKVTSIELRAYTRDNYFLAYRLNGALQYGANNRTLPVVRGNKLAGFMLRNDTSGQTIDIIATQVIRHFLKDAQKPNYQGFPRAGFHYGPMLDPQLRRYIGLPEEISGIYVQKVIKGGPAGGGFSTVKDLHRFARAILTGKLVSQESLDKMWKDHSGENYGFGFSVEEGTNGKVVGHGGGFSGINSNLDIYLDREYIVAVMSNYDRGASPVAQKIGQLLARVK